MGLVKNVKVKGSLSCSDHNMDGWMDSQSIEEDKKQMYTALQVS